MRGGTERDVVVEAVPRAPFEMIEAEFAFEFLIVPLDAPAEFAEADERADRRRLR